MARYKELNRYQQGLLWVLAMLVLVFGIVYAVVSSRVGFLYQNAVLLPQSENGSTVYSGIVQWEPGSFTVTQDKTVTFRWGDRVYGPYTAREDPSAIPQEDPWKDRMTGVEILEGENLIFRGGVTYLGMEEMPWRITREDGTSLNMVLSYTVGDGDTYDMDGNIIDPMKPTVSTILELMRGPELESKGQWLAWLLGVLISAAVAVSILYADELFYWSLAFRIQSAEWAEPSDLTITGRYIAWTAMVAVVLYLYIIGLL